MSDATKPLIRGRTELPVDHAKPPPEKLPSYFTRERVFTHLALLAVLGTVGYQLAQAYGLDVKMRLPDWSIKVLGSADVAVAALFVKFAEKSEIERIEKLERERPKEHPETPLDPIATKKAVRRETKWATFAIGALILALGLQLTDTYLHPIPFGPHLVNALGGIGAMAGSYGLYLEYNRWHTEEALIEPKAAEKQLGHKHTYTQVEVGMLAFTYLMAMTTVGIQIAQTLNAPVSMRDLDLAVSVMAGSAVFLTLFASRVQYWGDIHHVRRLKAAGLLSPDMRLGELL